MNIGKGFFLLLSLSTGEDCDVTASYRDMGKIEYIGPPETKAYNFLVAQTKTSLFPKLTGQAVGREVTNITIRNKGTAANVATFYLRDANGDYEVYSESIGAGQELIYEQEVGWTLATHSTIGIVSRMIAPADVVNAAANTLADVTGLTFPILSGKTYRFRAVVPYTSTATTNGSRWTTNGPALTKLNGYSTYPLVAAGAPTYNAFTAHQIPAAANATSLTVGNVAIIEGEIQPSADGTFAIQFASENAAGDSITALAGATLDIVRVL